MQQKITIAIDGFSSCGKSTLAKQLAKQLHYIYADSGAMYRAITLYFLQNSVNINHANEIIKALQNVHLSFSFNQQKEKSDVYLNDENVDLQIREMSINQNVSAVAAIKEVREFAVTQQKKMGADKGIVMDGRDIGTAVFPDAELKIFMTADIDVRVERRFKEMFTVDKNVTTEEVKKNLEMRDYVDSTREISPLRKANDAIVLDNTNLTMQEQLTIALQWANSKIKPADNSNEVLE